MKTQYIIAVLYPPTRFKKRHYGAKKMYYGGYLRAKSYHKSAPQRHHKGTITAPLEKKRKKWHVFWMVFGCFFEVKKAKKWKNLLFSGYYNHHTIKAV